MTACSGANPAATSPSLPPDAEPRAIAGAALVENRRCTSCHSLDGSRSSGPTWKGLAGTQRNLSDGRTVVVDDEYLRRALVQPDADVPKGYSAGIMSSVMKNQKQLTAEEVEQLVAYMKTVR